MPRAISGKEAVEMAARCLPIEALDALDQKKPVDEVLALCGDDAELRELAKKSYSLWGGPSDLLASQLVSLSFL